MDRKLTGHAAIAVADALGVRPGDDTVVHISYGHEGLGLLAENSKFLSFYFMENNGGAVEIYTVHKEEELAQVKLAQNPSGPDKKGGLMTKRWDPKTKSLMGEWKTVETDSSPADIFKQVEDFHNHVMATLKSLSPLETGINIMP